MITTAREEQYLAKYAGKDVPIPEPKTRTEMYLAKMAGMDVEPPAPITREEQILSAIAENGGGGGGDSDFSTAQVTITENASAAFPAIKTVGDLSYIAIAPETYNAGVYDIVLYKGHALLATELTVTGSAELIDEDEGVWDVSGAITIS